MARYALLAALVIAPLSPAQETTSNGSKKPVATTVSKTNSGTSSAATSSSANFDGKSASRDSELLGREAPSPTRRHLDWSSLTPAVVIALCSLVTAGCSFFLALFNFWRSNYCVVRVVASNSDNGVHRNRGAY